MAIGERFRGGGARGIARFLADHQSCDAGFDVQRDAAPGRGRLRIACKGCGQTVEYKAAEAGELAAGGLEGAGIDDGATQRPRPTAQRAPVRRRPPPPVQDAPAPPPHREPPRDRESQQDRESPRDREPPRDRELPRWLPAALIGALIAGGLALIAVGLLGSDEDEDPIASAETTFDIPTTPEPPAPSEPPPAAPVQPPPAAAPSTGGQPAVALRRQSFPGDFTIGIAPGWDAGTDEDEGAITIVAPRGAAEIDIYFEAGERPPDEMARLVAGYLRGRNAGERTQAPQPFQLGGIAARRIDATHPRGTEMAVVLSEDGYTYLIVRSLHRKAPLKIVRQAEAGLASFRT